MELFDISIKFKEIENNLATLDKRAHKTAVVLLKALDYLYLSECTEDENPMIDISITDINTGIKFNYYFKYTERVKKL